MLLFSRRAERTAAIRITTVMNNDAFSPLALLRMQSWLSPAFPAGSYSYSHGLEWAVESGAVCDRPSLVEWLDADLRHGSGRNEACLFKEAWRCGIANDREAVIEGSELAAAFRGTSEFALESSQPAAASLSVFKKVWTDPALEWLEGTLHVKHVPPALAVVSGVRL